MENIILKLRDIIQDSLNTKGRDSFDYDYSGQSKVFTLSEANIASATIVVKKNGIVWANTNYSFDSDTCELTVSGTLEVGDNLLVTYSYYAKYSDTELQGFIRAAISYLVIEKYKCFAIKPPTIIFPSPDEGEENLIALIASILIKGDIVNYKTPELTINFEKSESKEKKIKTIIRHYKKSSGYFTYVDREAITLDENEDLIHDDD